MRLKGKTALVTGAGQGLGKHNITVNAIAPGLTLSDGVIQRGGMNEERLGVQRDEKPEDLVGAASFLASDDAGGRRRLGDDLRRLIGVRVTLISP